MSLAAAMAQDKRLSGSRSGAGLGGTAGPGGNAGPPGPPVHRLSTTITEPRRPGFYGAKSNLCVKTKTLRFCFFLAGLGPESPGLRPTVALTLEAAIALKAAAHTY